MTWVRTHKFDLLVLRVLRVRRLLMWPIVHRTCASVEAKIHFSLPVVPIVKSGNYAVETVGRRRHCRSFQLRISCFMNDCYLWRMLSWNYDGIWSVRKRDSIVRGVDCLWLIHFSVMNTCRRPATFNKIHYRRSLFSLWFYAVFYAIILVTTQAMIINSLIDFWK